MQTFRIGGSAEDVFAVGVSADELPLRGLLKVKRAPIPEEKKAELAEFCNRTS